jgi:hypothetical protein
MTFEQLYRTADVPNQDRLPESFLKGFRMFAKLTNRSSRASWKRVP